jgi:hypothetical protein
MLMHLFPLHFNAYTHQTAGPTPFLIAFVEEDDTDIHKEFLEKFRESPKKVCLLEEWRRVVHIPTLGLCQ